MSMLQEVFFLIAGVILSNPTVQEKLVALLQKGCSMLSGSGDNEDEEPP